MMKTARPCSRCGTPQGDAAGGLCLVCAGRLALETSADETAANAPALGVRLGDYEILDELGRGAMGVVFRARQLSLKRIVALKVVLNGQFASEAERRRFLSEVEFAATLDHPNIVSVYEVGSAEGRPFCAMKLIDGQPLAQRIAHGSTRISEREAAALLARVARAVHHAHQRGIIHRDLKPANILVDAAGQPHITDFGLARRIGVESSLSLTGSPLGTPAYMSPEQARGEKTITTAADIWSLGVLLYELLAGHPPFAAENVPALLRKIVEDEVPAVTIYDSRFTGGSAEGLVNRKSEIVNPVDPDLATICLKCLEKDPARRYASAAELADDLERWQRNEPILARRSSAWERALKWCARHPQRAMMIAVLLAVFLAGVGGVVWQWQRANRHAIRAEQRAEESRDRLVRLHVLNAEQRLDEGDPLAALPWFAAALAEEAPNSPRRNVHRAALANLVRRSVTLEHVWWLPGQGQQMALSPDGQRLVVVDSQSAQSWLLRLSDGERVDIGIRGGSSAAFSADGSRFAVGGYNRAYLCAADTAQPVAPPLPHANWVSQVEFSPDGRWLATLSRKAGIRFWNAATGEPAAPELSHPSVMSCAFSPDSRRLASSGQDEFLRVWEVPSGRLLASRPLGSPWRCVFSPDGKWLLVGRRGAHDALLLDAASLGDAAPSLRHKDYVERVAFSPDSRRVATGSLDGTVRTWAVPGGEPLTPPIHLGSECLALAFSPDGAAVAAGGRDGRVRVWDACTGAPRTPWLRHAGSVQGLRFTPDGLRLCSSGTDEAVRIWRLKPPEPDSHALRIPGQEIWNAHFFQESRRVVVRGSRGARVFDTATAEALTPLMEHGAGVHWADVSPEGTMLLTEGRDHRVRTWHLPGGEPGGIWDLGADVVDAAWLASPGRFATLAENGDLAIRSISSNAPVRRLMERKSVGRQLTVSSDRRMFAAAFSDRKLGLWRENHDQPIALLDGPAEVRKIRFSPDLALMAAGDDGGGIRFHRTRDGQRVGGVVRHGERILDLAFSHDSRRLASVSADGLVRVSRVPEGELATAVIRPETGAMQLAWSPDGRWLLVGGPRSGRIWDADTSAPVTPQVHYNRTVAGAAFASDGRHLLVLTDDGQLRRERLDVPDWPDEDWRFLARALSSQEVDAGGSALPWRALGETNTQAAADTLTTRWRDLRPRLEQLASPGR